jgi:hypothetical protein
MGSLDFSTKKHCCYICGSTKTKLNTKGSENWYHNYGKDKPICNRCYGRLIESPKRRARKEYREKQKAYNRKYDRNRLRFLGHAQQLLTFRPLTGYCSQCQNNVYDGTCKMTNMHHWVYIIILPWFGTEEVCIGCHNKTKDRDWHGRFC